jgi:sialidase-1
MKPAIPSLTILTLLLCQSLSLHAAESAPASTIDLPASAAIAKSDWNGYQKQSFTLDGCPAYVVVPQIAAPGKPWVWRTSFPDYCPVVDLELARCGYHIGYVEILDLLGSDAALNLMDQFYAQVRMQWGLAEKPALEPCSRGGLPAYRYAARHPERIACIYGDVPVMDFKSWPLQHPASKTSDWPKIMKAYGFKTDAEAMAYPNNPIDQLAPIAKARIPIRHVICLNDRVVPPEQNTLEAKRRLEKLGSTLEVVSVKESNDCEGHHFPYPDVFGSVRFIMQHACVLPTGKEFFDLRDGLNNSRVKFEQDKTGRVAFLGGSITHNSGWRDETIRYLQQRFPQTQFDFISAGIPSLGSVPHAFRLERDVLARGPVDLLFVEAAVNDRSNIPNEPARMLRGMEGVVRHARQANPLTDIVQMHFVMPEDMTDYNSGRTPAAIAQHEKVATHYGNASLNLSREVTDRINAGQFTWATDFRDLHPSPYGQRLYANSIARLLDAAYSQPSAPAKAHPMPAQPLDPQSYFHGRFGALTSAKLGSGFKLVPDWIPTISRETRGGYVHVPALAASTPGAEFEFEFEGAGAGLMIGAGPDTGIIEVSVDGGATHKLDTFTPWSQSLYLPWALMLADELTPGRHTVHVRLATEHNPKSSGTALYVFQLLEN